MGIPDRGGHARGAGIREGEGIPEIPEGAGIPEIPEGVGIPEIPEGVGIPEGAGTLGDRYMRGEGGYTRGGISIQEGGQYTRGVRSGTSEGVGGWKAGAMHPTGISSCETCKPNGLII